MGGKSSWENLPKEIKKEADILRKRAKRLQDSDLADLSPAYQALLREFPGGKISYRTRGKSYNELQKLYWTFKKINQMQTSTVKGMRQYIKHTAALTIGEHPVKNIQELETELRNFFRLADMYTQYMQSLGETGFGYLDAWDAVRNYINEGNDISGDAEDLESTFYDFLSNAGGYPNAGNWGEFGL